MRLLKLKIYKDGEWVLPTREEAIAALVNSHGIPADKIEKMKIYHNDEWISVNDIIPEA